MSKRMFAVVILFLFNTLGYANESLDRQCTGESVYRVGAGIYDITGPIAEQRMMGYAMLKQVSEGLYTRLYARAFVIDSPCNNKRVVFVNADLGQVFQAVKMRVVDILQEKYGTMYSHDNVLITATHQHSGPGGYSTYTLYDLTILGFDRNNFDAIVNGIVAAIERAQANISPATIRLAKGHLPHAGFNRSPQSYLLNPSDERARYNANVDDDMTVLRFDRTDGTPIGTLNWFAVHGVSMNNKNHLINSDNKGYAEYLFEKDFHSDYSDHAFVAAFAQSNAGDVSPNENGEEGGTGLAGLAAVEKSGQMQYQKAKELYAAADELVQGGVDYRHEFINMSDVTIDPQYTNGVMQTTCPPAIGVSMLAGTTDGEGFGKQGVTCDNISGVFPWLACSFMTTTCQAEKPIALELENKKPYPWVPTVLPLQVIKIGQLVIAAMPFEVTTMSGRRLRSTIQHALPNDGPHHVVLSTLANAYVQYLTTREEYTLQRYEGASNLFGPWTLAALQQEFTRLSTALVSGRDVDPGPMPADLLDHQVNLVPGVLYDSTPWGKHFGDLQADVRPRYLAGETVTATFYGAHPKNDYHNQTTFLEVQQRVNGTWVTIRQDVDWDTELHWRRSGLASSLVDVVWRIPAMTAPGQYRLVYHGDAKSFLHRTITPFTGFSSVFTVL